MEPAIRSLDYHTDEATRHMLDNLVKKKRKFDAYKNKRTFWRLATFLGISFFLIYITMFVIQPNAYSAEAVLSVFLGSRFHLYAMMGLAGCFGSVLFYQKKTDKAEKEYHDLRCEIIERSMDLWPHPVHWQKRHDVFTMMKKEFDINLYYESK